MSLLQSAYQADFYPRPPRGGRQGALYSYLKPDQISIHALREEGDRSPSPALCTPSLFLSTPSARRATPADLHG